MTSAEWEQVLGRVVESIATQLRAAGEPVVFVGVVAALGDADGGIAIQTETRTDPRVGRIARQIFETATAGLKPADGG